MNLFSDPPQMLRHIYKQGHHNDRIGWLRAAAAGVNDGIFSTASLLAGIGAG